MKPTLPNPTRLIAFDYDGTITAKDSLAISDAVTLGIQELWRREIPTTILTARPLQRLLAISGGIHAIVPLHIPIATERGARIIRLDKTINLDYHPLKLHELQEIADMPKQDIDFIGFYPEAPFGKSFIWNPDPARNIHFQKAFAHDATILPNDEDALWDALMLANPCLVTVKFKVLPSILTLSDNLNVARDKNTISLVTAGIDKLSALTFLCQAHNIPFEETIYAGNDLNDLPVLALPQLKGRIFVGQQLLAGIAKPHVHVASPEELGVHLLKISKEIL